MDIVTNIAVGIVALIHVYIMVLEMFLWEKPIGLHTFGMDRDFAAATRVLGANQGLYNGFLAAGLVWGLAAGNVPVQHFFLSCVLVAGVYGALTVHAKMLWVQALPAMMALTLIGWV